MTEHRTILYKVEPHARIRYNTYGHTGKCILCGCFISRGAIFSRSGPHGRVECLAPLRARL